MIHITEEEDYVGKRERARVLYGSHSSIINPYFQCEIILNSEGFYHLRYSGKRERTWDEQILKFTLLPLGLNVLRVATTVQEYRKDGGTAWWGFTAIFPTQGISVRVIVRKVGNGKIHFWSVMPAERLNKRTRSLLKFKTTLE